jgi:hypothetical protein
MKTINQKIKNSEKWKRAIKDSKKFKKEIKEIEPYPIKSREKFNSPQYTFSKSYN